MNIVLYILKSLIYITDVLVEILLWLIPLVSKAMTVIAVLWIVWETFSRIYDLFVAEDKSQ